MDAAEHAELFIKGAIVGHLIGDALGYPWSGSNQVPDALKMIVAPGGEEPGEYTCHGALSIATIASINECEGIDQDDLMEKFYEVYIGGYMTSDGNCYDVGKTTSQAINNHSNGMPIDRCGLTNEESNDGDALARMLPVALHSCTKPIHTIIDIVHKVCGLTHRHPRSQVVCAAYCLMVRNLLLQKAEKVFDTLLQYYRELNFVDHFESTQNLQQWTKHHNCSGLMAEDCLWTAWRSFSKYENDFRFTVTEAIQSGFDKNACGAVAGSLAAVANGLNDIPTDWLKTIRLTSEVMEVVMNFTTTTANIVTT